MDRERLTELLQDPSQVAKQDLSALRNMAERFPWFSGAHLLLAVGEHETGDVLANDRHSDPAAFLPSRAVLFDLVRQEELKRTTPLRVVKDEIPLPTEANSGESEPEAGTKVEEPVVLDAAKPIEKIQLAVPEAPVIDLPQVGIAPDPKLRMPPGSPLVTEKDEVPPDPAAQILELQIQQAILAAGYDLGRYESTPAAAAPPPAEIIPPPLPPLPQVEDLAAKSDVAPPAPVQKEPAPIHREFVAHTRLRFTDWLQQSDTDVPEPEAVTPGRATVNAILKEVPSEPAPPVDAHSSGITPEEIMEHFIQRSSPPPAATKTQFFNPQQAAKRSLQDDGLVSETLARIHEKQGNFAKAKEVYDRLAMKHPEKSVYFAALSKAVEGRMHK